MIPFFINGNSKSNVGLRSVDQDGVNKAEIELEERQEEKRQDVDSEADDDEEHLYRVSDFLW